MYVCQPESSEVGRLSHEWPQPTGSSHPPETAFWPASHTTVKSPPVPGPADQVAVLTTTRPAAVLAGPGACAACDTACCTRAALEVAPSFFARSAVSACLALSAV